MAAADYWSQAQLDPAYLAAHGGNKQQVISALLGYGSSTAAAPATLAQYGITPADVAAADQNPYSTTANLAQQLSGDRYAITNTANSHGALYSGAHAAAQAHETQAGAQRNYTASQALASQLAGIGQNDVSSLTGAYGRISDQALNTPTPVAAPAVTPVAPAPVGSTPDTQTWAANPSGFNAGAPQNAALTAIKPPALPKIKTVKTGLLGHL